MKILFWIVSLGLVAFEMAAGIGKQIGGKMAIDWMNKLKALDSVEGFLYHLH